MPTVYLSYLQMWQATQFCNFKKKLMYIQKYSNITYRPMPLQAEEALGPISIPRGSREVGPF
jgi:hypothetical protein